MSTCRHFFMVDEPSRVLIAVCCQFSQGPTYRMATEDAVNTIKSDHEGGAEDLSQLDGLTQGAKHYHLSRAPRRHTSR